MADAPKLSPLGWLDQLRAMIWKSDLAAMSAPKARCIRLLQVTYAVGRDLADGQLNLRAMSLVYTTILSLVPLLAISFSVLKGFGVHNQLEPMLLGVLEPLGDKGFEITEKIIGFVENVKVGVLGSLGLMLLVYTVVSLMQKIERAFNYTWHVSAERPFAQRFSDYLSVVLIGPILVFTSMGISASLGTNAVTQRLADIEPFGTLIGWLGVLVPYLLTVAAFAFIYSFIPNTKVKLKSAVVGALVSGVLWKGAGWAFKTFILTSVKYTAIYSAFATLIMFMIWLYLGWLILLVGASIAFYHQKPEYLGAGRGPLRLSNRVKEKLAILVSELIGANYYSGREPWTLDALSTRLRAPMDATGLVLSALENRGLLKKTGDDPPAYLPGRPPETTMVKEVIDAVRIADETAQLNPDQLPTSAAAEQVFGKIDRALSDGLENRTLKDLALDGRPNGQEKTS